MGAKVGQNFFLRLSSRGQERRNRASSVAAMACSDRSLNHFGPSFWPHRKILLTDKIHFGLRNPRAFFPHVYEPCPNLASWSWAPLGPARPPSAMPLSSTSRIPVGAVSTSIWTQPRNPSPTPPISISGSSLHWRM